MTIGEISDILVWGAATAYTIAMVAFGVDMAKRGAAVPQEDELVASAQPAVVGASAVPIGRSTARGTAPRAGARASDSARGVTAWGAWRTSASLGVAMSTATLGVLFNLAAIVTRGIAAGRAPWANMYEFTLVGAFCTMAVFLVVQRRVEIRFLGIFVTMLAVSALMVALNAFHVEAAGVQPALQSYWLVIHVGVAILATGVFAVAFASSLVQLFKDSRETGSAVFSASRWRWLDTVPGAAQLEMLSFRINSLGFVLWTFTIIGGSVWAEGAWGRYWGWDPKEVWSFVIWVVYAAYLHARTTRGWSGRRAAYFVIVGFACVLFNFTGVNILFSGKHAYSQI